MFGILLMIAILFVMGFILAFVHNLFEQEELPVGRATLIVFLTGVAGFVTDLALESSETSEGAAGLIGLLVYFAVMTLLLKMMAYVSWGKAAIMSIIFSIVIFLISLGIAAFLTTA